MALGTPTLATPTVGSGTLSTVSTASFTATLDTLYLAMGGLRRGAATNAITVTNTIGLTFAPLLAIDAVFDSGSGARVRGNMWAAVGNGASGTFTWSSAGAVTMVGAIVGISGASGIPANISSATDVGGDPSVVLGTAPASSSCNIGMIACAGTTAVTPPAGYTELSDFLQTDLIIEVIYDLTSPPTTTAWTTSDFQSVAIVAEVQELAGVGGAGRFIQRQGQRQALLVR